MNLTTQQLEYRIYKDLLINREFVKRNGGIGEVIKLAEKLIKDLERQD
jgi:hypothetical protein